MTTRTPDQDAIEACVQKYIDGVGQHRTDLIVEAFHPDASMSIHRGPEFTVVPVPSFIVDFMKTIPPVYETSPDFAGRILSIEQHGPMATAVIAEDKLEGLNFITYFHVHKVDGNWVITSKSTYGEPVQA